MRVKLKAGRSDKTEIKHTASCHLIVFWPNTNKWWVAGVGIQPLHQ